VPDVFLLLFLEGLKTTGTQARASFRISTYVKVLEFVMTFVMFVIWHKELIFIKSSFLGGYHFKRVLKGEQGARGQWRGRGGRTYLHDNTPTTMAMRKSRPPKTDPTITSASCQAETKQTNQR
jgi:hypothetical protein